MNREIFNRTELRLYINAYDVLKNVFVIKIHI